MGTDVADKPELQDHIADRERELAELDPTTGREIAPRSPSLDRLPRAATDGIPDLKWINHSLPIEAVARKLCLKFGDHGKIHCWHPERHQNGDRTPSVSIRKVNNTIRCFGCGAKPMSVVDLV